MALGCTVAKVEPASRDYADLTTADICLPVGLQTLATTTGSLDIDLTALDGEDGVTLDTSGCLGLQIFRVPLTITSADHIGASTIDDDIFLAVDAFRTFTLCLHIDDATIDNHIVAGLDAVVDCGVDIEVHALVDDHIALAVDAVVIGTIYLECTITTNE